MCSKEPTGVMPQEKNNEKLNKNLNIKEVIKLKDVKVKYMQHLDDYCHCNRGTLDNCIFKARDDDERTAINKCRQQRLDDFYALLTPEEIDALVYYQEVILDDDKVWTRELQHVIYGKCIKCGREGFNSVFYATGQGAICFDCIKTSKSFCSETGNACFEECKNCWLGKDYAYPRFVESEIDIEGQAMKGFKTKVSVKTGYRCRGRCCEGPLYVGVNGYMCPSCGRKFIKIKESDSDPNPIRVDLHISKSVDMY